MVEAEIACNPDLHTDDLEQLLVFSVLVANKPAERMSEIAYCLTGKAMGCSPLEVIELLVQENRLGKRLRELRTGQYGRIEAALRGLVTKKFNLRTCSVADLESIKGIGPKTARFFIMRTT